jgi:hypothetical protein
MSELKQAPGRKMANGKGGQRGTTEEGKWPQRVRTKGNGRRAALAKTRLGENDLRQQKMTFRQQKTTKLCPKGPKLQNTDVQAHCAKLYKHVNRKGHHGSKGLNSKITMKTDLKTTDLNLKNMKITQTSNQKSKTTSKM